MPPAIKVTYGHFSGFGIFIAFTISVTAMFHIVWPLTSVGMSLVLVIFEALMGMTISYYPYMIPSPITIMEAASSRKTLIFMLSGIGFLVPVMLVYNGYQYFVFSGK
jgi:cytochrome bd-type quinol oxidase subunit 2